MRILMVTSLLPDPRGRTGGAQVMYGAMSQIAKTGSVTLATFARSTGSERDTVRSVADTGIDVNPVWIAVESNIGGAARKCGLAARWLAGGLPLRTLAFQRSAMQKLLDDLMARREFDLIHVEDNAMAQYSLGRAVPRILSEHEVRTGDGLREKRRWLKYQRAAWKRFDTVQLYTEADRVALDALAPEITPRTRVNPFGVVVPPASVASGEAEDDLLFMGNFLHPPNLDAALWLCREIWPIVRAARPGASLSLVGANPPPAIRSLAGDGVVVTGEVSDIQPFIRKASIVVAPVRVGLGMRVKVLEAMSHGKAVVTTEVGAAGLSVGGGPVPVAIGNDADTAARAIVSLLENHVERRGLGARARAHVVANFTWDAYGSRLNALHRELVEGNHGRSEVA